MKFYLDSWIISVSQACKHWTQDFLSEGPE